MDQFLNFLKNLGNQYNELSPGKKGATLALVAAALAAIMLMSLWARSPDYQLLYANLSPEDAAQIVDQLKTQNIDYDLANQGRNVLVPADQVYELRLSLASEGLPEGREVGLELFEETPLGMTEFVQKLNFQRALQGELVRTIKSLDSIQQARVHLVIPKDNLFFKEKPRGKASVMIKIKPGKSLTESQIQGIVHLVASSVEGVAAQDVVVVDLNGDILSGGREVAQGVHITSSNYKHQRKVEQELEDSIVRMLEDALGKGTVLARVSAELDFDRTEHTEETFDPDSQVVRSEQLTTESSVGASPPAGVPGVQSLTPEGESKGSATGTPAQRNKENQTFNYEINKVVTHTRRPTGTITKLSVGVMIDGTYTGDPLAYQAKTPEEMAQYLDIVKSIIGYDKVRGDQIKLENVQFDKTLLAKQQELLAQDENIDLGLQVVKYLIIAIFILLVFARVIRPLMSWLTTTVEVVPETAPPALPGEAMEEEETEDKLLQAKQMEATGVRQSVKDFVENDPKYTAGILRKWMRER